MSHTEDNRALRVLLLSPTAQLGGAERMLLDMIGSLRDAIAAGEVDVHVLTLGDGPLVAALRDEPATVRVVPLPQSVARLGDFGGGRDRVLARAAIALPALLGLVRRMRRVVRQVRPHVIHSNGAKTHVLSRWLVPGDADDPILVWHLHDFLGRRRLLGRVLRRLARRTNVALAVSEAVANDARFILPATPILTLLNAIDVDHFTPEARAESGDVRIGLVATYARWKGHDIFLRAAAQLVRSNRLTSQVRFFIIGGPIYQTHGSQFVRDKLVSLAEQLGVRDIVEFVDFQADPLTAYHDLDIVVHASTQPEPFGRTIVEAMACGRAVIVSAAGGAAELVRDGVDALAVAPGDVSGLADAIARLVTDPELRQRLGTAARETAVARFDRRRLGPQLLSIYRQCRPVRQSFGTHGNPSHTPPSHSSSLPGKKVESA